MFLVIAAEDPRRPFAQRHAKPFREPHATDDRIAVHERESGVGRQVIGLQQKRDRPDLSRRKLEALDDRARLGEGHEAVHRMERARAEQGQVAQGAG
jgi:hypothetical protein